jgi:hypothetical protein
VGDVIHDYWIEKYNIAKDVEAIKKFQRRRK